MTRRKQQEDNGQQFDEVFLENVRRAMKRQDTKDIIIFILDQCGLYTDTFTGNSTTFMLIGQQRIGLAILNLLQSADPTIYPKLLLEHNQKKEAERS